MYPPEVNAARIAGAGPAGWFAVAAEWAKLAAGLDAIGLDKTAANAVQTTTIDGNASDALDNRHVPFDQWTEAARVESARASLAANTVAQAHSTAVSTMIPLPVIAANRAALAAASMTAVVGVVNPDIIRLEMEYAGFQVHNAAVMETYDATVTAATAPKHYPAPPRLTGATGPVGDVVPASYVSDHSAVERESARMQDRATMAAMTADARRDLPADVARFEGQTYTNPSTHTTALATAQPALNYVSSMTPEVSGVRGNGLAGGANTPMAPFFPNVARAGGLPLAPVARQTPTPTPSFGPQTITGPVRTPAQVPGGTVSPAVRQVFGKIARQAVERVITNAITQSMSRASGNTAVPAQGLERDQVQQAVHEALERIRDERIDDKGREVSRPAPAGAAGGNGGGTPSGSSVVRDAARAVDSVTNGVRSLSDSIHRGPRLSLEKLADHLTDKIMQDPGRAGELMRHAKGVDGAGFSSNQGSVAPKSGALGFGSSTGAGATPVFRGIPAEAAAPATQHNSGRMPFMGMPMGAVNAASGVRNAQQMAPADPRSAGIVVGSGAYTASVHVASGYVDPWGETDTESKSQHASRVAKFR